MRGSIRNLYAFEVMVMYTFVVPIHVVRFGSSEIERTLRIKITWGRNLACQCGDNHGEVMWDASFHAVVRSLGDC